MARILIIEDDNEVREYLENVLARAGYEVCSAANGQEGVEFFANQATELVITDIIMPEKDGIEMVVHVKDHHPEVKIIAMSAPSNEVFLDTASKLGAARVFEKPLDLAELVSAVEEVLAE